MSDLQEGSIAFEVEATLLEFVLNEYKPGVMARYGAGIDGPGIVIFPSTDPSVERPIKDTGWHLVRIKVMHGKNEGDFFGFAEPIENRAKLVDIIANLRRQLAKC